MASRLTKYSLPGRIMMLVGLLVSFPIVLAPFLENGLREAVWFLVPGAGSVALGMLVCAFWRQDGTMDTAWRPTLQRTSLTVLFAWVWGILVGSLPFLFGMGLTPVQALFESVSGWTTTGLSVIDVTKCSDLFLFYRSFIQFCGGLGFVAVMMVIVVEKQSMSLYNAEGHSDQIKPNLKKSAQAIGLMYCGFLLAGTIAYRLVGMSWFDGVNHAMCALSTGGFSTRLNSIGEYESVAIDIVTIVLMLIGTTNFAALMLLVKGKWKKFSKISEVRFMAVVLLVVIPMMTVSLSNAFQLSLWDGFKHAAFDSVSALSTSGFSSMAYDAWPPFAIGLMIVLMLFGGGAGSTAGGIKLNRVYLMLRFAKDHMRAMVSNKRQVHVSYYETAQGKTAIDESLKDGTTTFVTVYFCLFLVGSLLITLTAGCGLTEGMFEFASSLGTVGLSIGLTNPATAAPVLLVEMFGMVFGRLEIFLIFTGLFCGWNVIRSAFSKRVGG
ncbi:TrkH family potassium uptake protein [Dubosiella muris]|uniref:TrkH family potassium uptake protein n=1 Tax=Dubosiella muris TaxID=3038133 RepID=A0AC61R8N2_9FIRM|nr:potassium transporter TrkG [Dubosiella muris]TGY66048.1 TrkH family potassium uptake protein [Dubosiella muris]